MNSRLYDVDVLFIRFLAECVDHSVWNPPNVPEQGALEQRVGHGDQREHKIRDRVKCMNQSSMQLRWLLLSSLLVIMTTTSEYGKVPRWMEGGSHCRPLLPNGMGGVNDGSTRGNGLAITGYLEPPGRVS